MSQLPIHLSSIRVKKVEFSYSIPQVFADMANLQHGSDGLIIIIPVSTRHTRLSDDNILKWKPPSENSIYFKLVLRFPPLPEDTPGFSRQTYISIACLVRRHHVRAI
ncbi:hypothetical protein C8F04DRAFT_1276409 [Mycena alexandri]|uniref:Uncharacterized protein n=1 Tax=Mycena alexandri TaxID=1745969 RepID=A0AAD6S2E3_9AGAR|nr:hypothetical protein C8F04DRAFT_1276409 [Mycena alexandri]